MKIETITAPAPNTEVTGNLLEIGKRYVFVRGGQRSDGVGHTGHLTEGEEVIASTLGYVVSIKNGKMYGGRSVDVYRTPDRHLPKQEELVQITCTVLEAQQLAHGAYYNGTNSQEETGDELRRLLDEIGHDPFEVVDIDA